jgi:hypothetical protein
MESRARTLAVELLSEIAQMERIVEQLPKTSGELQELLIELVDANIDKSEHFNRFPRRPGSDVSNSNVYDSIAADRKTVEVDWSRCIQRHERAVARLTVFAQKTRDRAIEKRADTGSV